MAKWSDKSFEEQVDTVLRTKKIRIYGEEYHTNDIIIGQTPRYLIDEGFKDLPMLYTKKHLLETVCGKEFLSGGNTHDIAVNVFKDIKSQIEDPIAVFESMTKKDTYVLLTELLDEADAPIIVSINNGGKGWVDERRIDANFVTSIYGKDKNFGHYIDRYFDENKVVFCEFDRFEELMEIADVERPKILDEREMDFYERD